MIERIGRPIERSEKQKERVVVEIGAGAQPSLLDSTPAYRQAFEADQTHRHINVDLNIDALASGRETQQRVDHAEGHGAQERISYVQANAESLPFGDHSVNEVLLRNVLGDPDVSVETKQAIVTEIARVLEPGGVLRVVEVYTPPVMYEDDMYEYIKHMPGTPFQELSDYELAALPEVERANDAALTRDDLAADTFMGGLSVSFRFRRT